MQYRSFNTLILAALAFVMMPIKEIFKRWDGALAQRRRVGSAGCGTATGQGNTKCDRTMAMTGQDVARR